VEHYDKKSLLKKMIRIRCFEEKVTEYKLKGKILGQVHCCSGQEAVVVGACSALAPTDYIISTHRSHGHVIAKGVDINLIMAEIFGKSTGTNGGKGGSMHIFDKTLGSICTTAIVGSGLPIGCGAAFASKYKEDGKITCVFLGDGAANEGTFNECMNLASIWKLPIIFLIENNGVAITTLLENVSVNKDLYLRTQAYNISSKQVDGQNIEEVHLAIKDAIVSIKEGKGPVLIEAKTCRFHEHAEGQLYATMTKAEYRNNQEVDYWKVNKDPIKLFTNKLVAENIIEPSEIEGIYLEENLIIENAIIFAEQSLFPNNNEAYSNIFN
jgi:acetoin:2,6-dichlorophenolindophenol oxidoreductase subunit alpha